MGIFSRKYKKPEYYVGKSGKRYTDADLVKDWMDNHKARILAHTTIDNVSAACGVPICSVDGIKYGIEWGGPAGGDPIVTVYA